MGLPIISTMTTPTSCLKKINKTNQILIIKIIVTKLNSLNEPLRVKREREESDKGAQRCKKRRRIPWQRMVSNGCGDRERRVIFF